MDNRAPRRTHEPKGGASTIVIRGGAVLMVKRAREPNLGLWSFPAGRREPGEDAEANARRELFEETGLRVGEMVRLGSFRPTKGSDFEVAVFAARAGEGAPRAGDDAAMAEYVPFTAVLEKPLTPGAAAWIARAIAALSDPPVG